MTRPSVPDIPFPPVQPRERFLALGAEALSDAELLAILLRSGVQGMPVLKLAEELLARHGNNLLSLSTATHDELCGIHGMGEAKSIGLAAAFALGRRMIRLRMETLRFSSPETIAIYIRSKLVSPSQEEFHALLLDSRLGLLRDVRVTLGLVDRSLVHAREVFREAIKEACATIIIAHNHPSGDTTPSREDIAMTKALIAAGKIIGINILDHIVVASTPQKEQPSYFSFKENKLLWD